jgi:hypothetical protein
VTNYEIRDLLVVGCYLTAKLPDSSVNDQVIKSSLEQDTRETTGNNNH